MEYGSLNCKLSEKRYYVFAFTVEHCNGVGRIENLHSIIQTKGNSTSYFAICEDGYKQLSGQQTFECKNKEWSPTVRCITKNEGNDAEEGNNHHSK